MESQEIDITVKRKYRDNYEKFFAPYGKFLAKIGISPNFISMIAIILAASAGLCFALSGLWYYGVFFYLGVFLLIASSLADMLDGSTARALGTDSPFGMVLDHTLDRYAEYFYFGGIMISGVVDPSIILFTFVGMLMASYIRAKAESVGKVSISVAGIFERKEKLTVVGFGAFLQGLYIDGILGFTQAWDILIPPLFSIGPLAVALIIVGFFSHVTALQRLFYAKKVVLGTNSDKEKEREK
ncbi:MAG: CDP-alcohol phosphatidyltransferase family protein [Candidatus Hodarchaeales archaeon]|jgi:phosphatidylglycerophosphate synthase